MIEDYDDEVSSPMVIAGTLKATAVDNIFTKQSQRKAFGKPKETVEYNRSLGDQSWSNSLQSEKEEQKKPKIMKKKVKPVKVNSLAS